LGPRVGIDAKIRVQHHPDERALGELVAFAESSAELDDQAKRQLDSVFPQIVGKPHRIEIRGYAVRRPLPEGSIHTNHWQLCYARCIATMNYLCERGIETNRIRLSQAGVYGSQPRGLDARWNARSGVEIFLLPEVAVSIPGVVEDAPASPDRLPHD
jgi:chemotaxis protein MotB